MKIYIASAMFEPYQKKRIEKFALLFKKLGHTVYVPHKLQIENADTLPNAEWAEKVFKADIAELDDCDAVFYFCEGMNGDIGAAWECGYAYAQGKKIFVEELKHSSNISLMVGQCADTEISSYQS